MSDKIPTFFIILQLLDYWYKIHLSNDKIYFQSCKNHLPLIEIRKCKIVFQFRKFHMYRVKLSLSIGKWIFTNVIFIFVKYILTFVKFNFSYVKLSFILVRYTGKSMERRNIFYKRYNFLRSWVPAQNMSNLRTEIFSM